MPDPMLDASRLLDEDAEVRRQAVEAVDTRTLAGRYALRQALLADRDAEVRARAARRLGEARDRRFTAALCEALGDERPSVRDRAFRALARMESPALLPHAARATREEPVWWVRRAAVRAAASVGGSAALDVLLAALSDPFWRVRHAAVQSLALLGEEDQEVRARVREAAARPGPSAAAAAWLATVWQDEGGALELGTSAAASLPWAADSLGDEDPAVTTARLERARPEDVPARALVGWLGDPHAPLRALARRRLREGADPEALLLATRWLDEPRVPHAAGEVRALLDRVTVDDVALAERILAEPRDPGAVAWAAGVAAVRRQAGLLARLRQIARRDSPALRRAALAGLSRDPESLPSVLAALSDPDETVRAEALSAWEQRARKPAAVAAWIEALLAMGKRASNARERRAVVEAAALVGDEAVLAEASRDEDASVRALALAARAARGTLAEEERQAAQTHEDPWMRAAVLDGPFALQVAATDPDPWLRRAAMNRLVSLRSSLRPEDLRAAALVAVRSPDPWLRARAADLLDTGAHPEELRALLLLSRDEHPMARAAAASALERCDTLDALLRSMLEKPARMADEETRMAAFTWLLRRADDEAFEELCAALRSSGEAAEVAAHLEALTLIFPDERFASAPDLLRRRPTPPARPRVDPAARRVPEAPRRETLRPLGRTGIALSPLVLSGAHGVTAAALEEAYRAGVNAFFWEPRYMELSRFLRSGRAPRDSLVLIAGTYHAGADAIRRDVERALRRLRTDRLDLFLLFWVRSRERLSREDFDALSALRDEGKVRAFGFSTHDRAIALEALQRDAWPALMIRHSAAHPGAEDHLFPEALARGTGVLTFTATCYGRLLQPVPGAPHDESPLPRAPDCYRYALSQPGVSACLCAPRSRRELLENLAVLGQPTLPEGAIASLRAHGKLVRAHYRRFDALLRKAPGGCRDTLRALLDEDVPEATQALPSETKI
jgi:HEAT repeat protein